MILNLNGGDNTSALVTELNNILSGFKSEISTMLTEFTNDINSDMTAISSEVVAIKNNVDTVNSNVSTVKSDVATVSSKVSTMSSSISNLGGAVKSIQRGIIQAGTSPTSYDSTKLMGGRTKAFYVEVSLSQVSDISKCVVITNTYHSGGYCSHSLLSNKTLRIYFYNSDNTTETVVSAINWQVIEFY